MFSHYFFTIIAVQAVNEAIFPNVLLQMFLSGFILLLIFKIFLLLLVADLASE